MDLLQQDSKQAWPRLTTGPWLECSKTLHLWSQLVGKTRLALAPTTNHWWHVPLYVSARGLNTSPIAYGTGAFEVELDLVFHRLKLRSSTGQQEGFALTGGTLAEFYARYVGALSRLGAKVAFRPRAVEIPEVILLDSDEQERLYDPGWANQFFQALLRVDRLFKEFRAGFIGKASPVHVFWGSFDLAVTRFSSRTAPLHPGGAPNCPDWVMHEAYSHELSSAGFWPGNSDSPRPIFYAYAYPEPDGFSKVRVLPQNAFYDSGLREFVLPYEEVRTAPSPELAVRTFLQTTYVAAAQLGGWDRHALERRTADLLNMEESHGVPL